MARAYRSAPVVPSLLVVLSLVPALAGGSRMLELVRGGSITPANSRFFDAPLPVVIHVLAVVPYTILGALQIASSLRRRWPAWHRAAGRYLAALGIVAALTGLWMTRFYPWPEGDGVVLYLLRWVFGSAMLASLLVGIEAARRGDFAAHGAWMLRGYAIGMGAGTQVLTHLPWVVLGSQPGELVRATLMGAGWVVNLVVAEHVIRRGRSRAAVLARTA